MNDDQFALISKTVADPSRLAGLRIIAAGEVTCSELKDHLGLTAATVSHHVKELTATGLVHSRREGKFLLLALNREVWKDYIRELQGRVAKA